MSVDLVMEKLMRKNGISLIMSSRININLLYGDLVLVERELGSARDGSHSLSLLWEVAR